MQVVSAHRRRSVENLGNREVVALSSTVRTCKRISRAAALNGKKNAPGESALRLPQELDKYNKRYPAIASIAVDAQHDQLAVGIHREAKREVASTVFTRKVCRLN